MKVWKRAAALVCALGFVGAGVACKSETEKKLEEMTPQTQVEDIAAALEGVKSLKLSMDAEAELKGTVEGEQGNVTMDAGIDLWLSKTDDFIDAKIVMDYSMTMTAPESQTEAEKIEAYLVDGYAYIVAEQGDQKMGVKTSESIFALLADEMGVEETEVKSLFATAFAEAEKVGIPADLLNEFMELSIVEPSEEKTETSMTITYDYKSVINNLIGNVTGITETTTIAQFIDSMLTDLNSDMTCEKLLDKVASYGAKTVKEVKAEIEKEFGVTAEELLAKVQSDDVVSILNEMEEGLGDQVKAFKLSDIMDVYGDMTIDQLIEEISGEELTVADAVAEAKEMLKTPMQQVMPIDEEAIDVLKAIKINTANTQLATEYDEDANLLAISAGVNASVKVEYAAEEVDLTMTSSVTYKLSDFSKSASEIKVPTDITWQEM